MKKEILAIGIVGCCLLVGILGYAIGNITANPKEIKSNDISIMHLVDDIYVMYSAGNITTFKLIDNKPLT